MIELIKQILGIGPKVDYQVLIENGAQIIDVRTQREFKSGHIKGSINLPLQTLHLNYSRIKKHKPVITCCASGMRSASAKNMLRANGFDEVHNGGGWMQLQIKIEQI